MTLRHHLAAAAVLTLAVGLAQAGPVPYTITVLGGVSKGVDTGGLFFGHDTTTQMRDGEAFKLVFTVDPNRGFILDDPALHRRSIQGGTLYSASSPISTTLTINGRDVSMAGDYSAYSLRLINTKAGQDVFGVVVEDSLLPPNSAPSALNVGVSSSTHDFLGSLDLDSAFNYTLQAGDQSGGHFRILEKAPAGSIYNRYMAEGDFVVSSISVSSLGAVTPAVPEPASLWLCSVGLVAATVARRRRS